MAQESIGGEIFSTFTGLTRDVTGLVSMLVALGVLTIALPALSSLVKLYGGGSNKPAATPQYVTIPQQRPR